MNESKISNIEYKRYVGKIYYKIKLRHCIKCMTFFIDQKIKIGPEVQGSTRFLSSPENLSI